MKTSSEGLDLIKDFEGFEEEAYYDTGNVVTIGYGTTHYPDGSAVKIGDTCTKEQATVYLQHDLLTAESHINNYVDVDITQEMFDAISSFTYNLGGGNLHSSTLLKLLNQKKYTLVPAQFLRWCKDDEKIVPGLLRRRRAEAEMFRSGIKNL